MMEVRVAVASRVAAELWFAAGRAKVERTAATPMDPEETSHDRDRASE